MDADEKKQAVSVGQDDQVAFSLAIARVEPGHSEKRGHVLKRIFFAGRAVHVACALQKCIQINSLQRGGQEPAR